MTRSGETASVQSRRGFTTNSQAKEPVFDETLESHSIGTEEAIHENGESFR
jgi:hypothetical protein